MMAMTTGPMFLFKTKDVMKTKNFMVFVLVVTFFIGCCSCVKLSKVKGSDFRNNHFSRQPEVLMTNRRNGSLFIKTRRNPDQKGFCDI